MFHAGFRDKNSFKRDNNQFKSSLGSRLSKPNWNDVPLEKIDKFHYSESREVAERSSREIRHFYDENEITVKGRENLKPIFNFSELSINSGISKRLAAMKFTKPTPIQSVTIPVALSGINIVGIAQTGSGKTLAYLIPAFDHISRMDPIRRGDGPIVLVLVPTRELAQQVQSVANDVSYSYKTACVYGGADRRKQMHSVSQGVHIIVATPGRLIDFLEQNVVDLVSRCSLLVMDEADRMLDLGFEPQIRIILQQIRPDRHLLMFSATWPKAVHRLVDDFMRDYHHVTIGNPDICSNHNIKQNVEVVDEHVRDEIFEGILAEIMDKRNNKTLVFCETKKKAEEVSWRINRIGYHSSAIHGDKSQSERERILRDFKSGRLCILVATDVASRGLDVHDIKFVVNYDFPNCTEDYIHRIGRTGRAQRSGTSYTFLTPKHFRQARDLIKILREANQEVPRDLLSLEHTTHRSNNNYSRWGDNRNGDKRRQSYETFGKRKYGNTDNYYSGHRDYGIETYSKYNSNHQTNNHSRMNYKSDYSNSYSKQNDYQTSYSTRNYSSDNNYQFGRQNDDNFFVPPPPPKRTLYSGYTTYCPPPPPPRKENL